MISHIITFISILSIIIHLTLGYNTYHDLYEWRRDSHFEEIYANECDFPIIDFKETIQQNISFLPNEQQPYIIRNAIEDWVSLQQD